MALSDLNLMVIFDVIMQERSVTKASHRLAMTQPSVSNAISRMRHVWQDPIFVKEGRGIKPTPFAENMWLKVRQPLIDIRHAAQITKSDIRQLARTFRIASTDWMTDLFWLPLRQRIEQHAPLVNLHAVPYQVNGEKLLLNADVDMVLDYFEGANEHIHSKLLFNNHFVCAMRPQHALAQKALTLDYFCQAQHLLMSLSGDAKGSVDRYLAQIGTSRRIAMTVNHCANMAKILTQTDLITTIPLPLIMKQLEQGQLIAKPLPFDLSPAPISMTWHVRQQRDDAHSWLRQQVLDVVQQEVAPLIVATSHLI